MTESWQQPRKSLVNCSPVKGAYKNNNQNKNAILTVKQITKTRSHV